MRGGGKWAWAHLKKQMSVLGRLARVSDERREMSTGCVKCCVY